MTELIGNLWLADADVRVITTNGTIKKNGQCVMGRGCAAEAKAKYPELPLLLGKHLKENGNVPQKFTFLPSRLVACKSSVPLADDVLVSFPVKHHWFQMADIKLIRDSAIFLRAMAGTYGWHSVVMPRPGCGNGGLLWSDVRPVIEPILDDRFAVITWR